MENVLLIVLLTFVILLAIVLIVKPICYYKIQEAVMGLFHAQLKYDEENTTMGRVVGIVVLVIAVFGLFMQLS